MKPTRRKFRFRLMTAMPLALVLLAACGRNLPGEPGAEVWTHEEVRRNAGQWAQQGAASYRYTLQVNCFCLPELVRPVIVEVRDDAPVSVTYADSGRPAPRDLFARYDTMAELFSLLQDAYDRGADRVTVTYDSQLGHPAQVYIDYESQAADEELGFTVRDVVPIL